MRIISVAKLVVGCVLNTCLNGGTCRAIGFGFECGFECECPQGRGGLLCERGKTSFRSCCALAVNDNI